MMHDEKNVEFIQAGKMVGKKLIFWILKLRILIVAKYTKSYS